MNKTTTWLAALALSAGAAQADDVTLTMWHQHPEWKAATQAILDAFEAENPGIKIDLEEIAGTNYSARLNTALAAGEAPDLFALPAGPETLAAAEAGYVAELTGKVDTSTLREAARGAVVGADGKVYGVPILGSYSVGLYYHRDKFAELGIEPPSTHDELMAMCRSLNEQGVTPMVVPASDGIVPSFMYMMLTASVMGADGFEALRHGERSFTDPDMVEAAKALQEMGQECFQPGALSTPYVEGKAMAAIGRGVMMPGGSADYVGYLEINPKADLGVMPFPGVGDNPPSTVTGLEYIFLVNSKSEEQDAAVTFLNWMMGETAQQMVVDTITMTTHNEVNPQGNRILDEFTNAAKSKDVRVWYELPETGGVWSVVQQNTAALILGEMTPEEFAQAAQDAVSPSAR
ncbi:extracellular solute-binding protein [Cognatishimia maritima]|uniref:Raffinose/stachyose/melibiose transport system substrate-binding protein n=1 Tax=Cognatishimia maritima TaxID=870908 RepID=A0A1M5US41_9RHOB|nr:extracellular solute-binding protein [Cognatishimia maritima]SHH65755.1 raffinose/stachyose/melibiose transport system substrate-binding protein [Cognatishimia maritima]